MTTAFLVFGLFVPRLTLLWTYCFGNMPVNSTPFALDVVGAILVPRFLIAYWTYENHVHVMWTIMYVVLGLAELSARPGINIPESKSSNLRTYKRAA